MMSLRPLGALLSLALFGCDDTTRFGVGDAAPPIDRPAVAPGDVGARGDATASETGVDVGLVDAPRTGERVRVVEGPAPVRPLVGAAIRAVGRSGLSMEAVTDALGEAAISLSPDGAPWSLTVAKRGYSVVSIVGLTGAPDGYIRLDVPIDFGKGGGVPVSGRVTNLAVPGSGPGARLFVDALNADPVMIRDASAGVFETSYYSEFPGLPLAVTVLETLDSHPSRIARSPLLPRDGTPVRDITLALPPGPSGFRMVTVPVELPDASSVTTEGLRWGEVSVAQMEPLYERSTVSVGRGQLELSAASNRVTFEVVDGEFAPNLGRVVLDANEVRTNLYVHRFDGTERLVVPTVTALASDGDSLGAVQARGAAAGADAIAVFVSPAEEAAPRWRCFFLPGAMPARLPELPTGFSPGELGIGPGRATIAVLAIWMREGRAWATPNSNGAVLGYGATVTTVYRFVSGDWR